MVVTTVAHSESWSAIAESDFPPYNFLEGDTLVGIDADIVSAVEAQLGLDFSVETAPWKRVVNAVDNGDVTFGFQFVGTPERFEKYNMVGPIRNGETVFMIRIGEDIRYNSLSDLNAYTIGVVNGYSYSTEFDAAEGLNKQAVNSNDLNVKKLINKRIDMIVGDRMALAYIAKSLGVSDQVEFIDRPLKVVPRYVAFAKEISSEAERFQSVLDALIADGTVDSIIAEYAF